MTTLNEHHRKTSVNWRTSGRMNVGRDRPIASVIKSSLTKRRISGVQNRRTGGQGSAIWKDSVRKKNDRRKDWAS